jgi:hypothetical protein
MTITLPDLLFHWKQETFGTDEDDDIISDHGIEVAFHTSSSIIIRMWTHHVEDESLWRKEINKEAFESVLESLRNTYLKLWNFSDGACHIITQTGDWDLVNHDLNEVFIEFHARIWLGFDATREKAGQYLNAKVSHV